MNKYEQLIEAWLTPAANCWYKDQCRNLHQSFYLYYKPSKPGRHGALVIAPEPLNEDWVLASSRLSPGWTRDQVYRHCFDLARRLPILDPEA